MIFSSIYAMICLLKKDADFLDVGVIWIMMGMFEVIFEMVIFAFTMAIIRG